MPTSPLLDQLLRRARAWCDEAEGRRAQLARALGWRPQEVSTYLAPKTTRKPCAEKALTLQAFLAAKRAPSPAPRRPAAATAGGVRNLYRAVLARRRS